MPRKFEELRAKMSPESRARVEAWVKETLAKMAAQQEGPSAEESEERGADNRELDESSR